ncbi:MAG: ABC transporter ATP-binding protein [Spirochaetales bacterium]|nr:ABC transporter ATP-binding protein [Spirochaetales bacterium]
MKEKFYRYLKKETHILIILLFISIALAVSVAFGVYLWKIIYDQLFKKPDPSLFVLIIVLSLSAVIVANLFKVLKDRMLALLNRNLVSRIRNDFLIEIMHYRYSFFLERNSSEFVKRATVDCQIIADGLSQSVMGVVNLLQIIFWLVFFLYLVPWMSLIYITLLSLLVGWVLIWRERYEMSIYEIGQEYDVLWKNLWEVFSGIKTIKLELLKPLVMRKMERNLNQKVQKYRMHMFYSNMLWNIFYLLPWLAMGSILMIAVQQIIQGDFSIGTLVFCFLFTERFLSPLNESVEILISLQGLKAARKRVAAYRIGDKEKGGNLKFKGIKEKIEFKEIFFSYPGSSFELKNIFFSLPAGKNVAISGKSGSGKSTLAALLVRLFDPQSGQILIDDVPHSLFDLESLRGGIVLVPQEIPIYHTTLRENIDIKHRLKDEEIISLIDRVRLNAFFKRMCAGLDTLLFEGGIDISGGERQRLGIARALALPAGIYIFDEVTASLDKETEKDIAELLYNNNSGITSLTITHNPGLLKRMDIIYDFKEGELIRRV